MARTIHGRRVRPGAWLGVDVGSSARKVFNFCLIRSEGRGRITVAFERGPVRAAGPAGGYPNSSPGRFEDLANDATWLSAAAESGARAILSESALVDAWLAALREPSLDAAVCIDAPCGFADEGRPARATEEAAARSFTTPSRTAFRADLQRFARAGAATPLRQRYYWKLVGLVAFRFFLERVRGLPPDAPFEAVASACTARGTKRVREVFPSDTYARAAGGGLSPAARRLLANLVAAPWQPAGNARAGRSSMPSPATMRRLLEVRSSLAADLDRGGPLPNMRKIPNDPAWADLWDAFTCAFVGACEAHGAARLLGQDRDEPARLTREGAILAPLRAGELKACERNRPPSRGTRSAASSGDDAVQP